MKPHDDVKALNPHWHKHWSLKSWASFFFLRRRFSETQVLADKFHQNQTCNAFVINFVKQRAGVFALSSFPFSFPNQTQWKGLTVIPETTVPATTCNKGRHFYKIFGFFLEVFNPVPDHFKLLMFWGKPHRN